MGENLGQHFLKDEAALAAIVAAGKLSPTDTVLEVGPGEGALTTPLLETGAKVVAVEKDPALVEKLQETFAEEIESGELKVIQADIRDLDPEELFANQPYKVIANIPYYLTGQLIEETLASPHQPEKVVLLVQKEVAERIIAAGGKESILSLSVKVFGTPRIVQVVPRDCFDPPPKVDSAILEISAISRDFFTNISEEDFFSLIKRGFGQKRKTLANNLDTDPRFEKDQTKKALEKCGLKANIRAERLTTDDWKRLKQELSTSHV
ncbi:MAG: 16S rRNA (adenine(1518)-N(6)/adenine(1519)-N(6))-dimethyltransferase RsmA [Candidatus Paceibacterota bacterium]